MTVCHRCIQDGCDCTYSPPLKLGRPRKAPVAAKNDRRERPVKAPLRSRLRFSDNGTASSSNSDVLTAPLRYPSHLDAGLAGANHSGYCMPRTNEPLALEFRS